jgi:hypothetical protein
VLTKSPRGFALARCLGATNSRPLTRIRASQMSRRHEFVTNSSGFGRFSLAGQKFSIPRPPVEAIPAGDSCEFGTRNRALIDRCGGFLLVHCLGATTSRPLTRIRAGQVSRRTPGDAAETWAAPPPIRRWKSLLGSTSLRDVAKNKHVFLDTPGNTAEACMSQTKIYS